jgi:hypothetical protein
MINNEGGSHQVEEFVYKELNTFGSKNDYLFLLYTSYKTLVILISYPFQPSFKTLMEPFPEKVAVYF